MAALKDKIPPHNEEAERATLGALLLDKNAISAAMPYVRAEDFYSPANGRVYEAVLDLFNSGGTKADILTVSEHLRSKGQLESVGGEPYVAALPNVVPTSANIEYYARVVRDCALRRTIIAAAADMTRNAYDESRETLALLDDAQRTVLDLTDRGALVSYHSAEEIVPKVIDHIDHLIQHKKDITGVPSGFDELDRLTSGFQNSEMIILGARPSIGKTALALNMASHIAVREGIPTAFFSLEMAEDQIMMRLLAAEAGIDGQNLRTGFLSAANKAALQDAAGTIYEQPLYIADTPNMRLIDLRSLARRLVTQKQVKVIFIDYLQLITMEGYERKPDFEKFSDISKSLKMLARELKVPVIALSQLQRDVEDKPPTLANIRGSGSIEQDADVVMLLHRERHRKNDEGGSQQDDEEGLETKLLLEKQRNGPTGEIILKFRRGLTKFEAAKADFRDKP